MNLSLKSLTKSSKYGTAANSYDLAKSFAILLMVVDHAGYFFFEDNTLFRLLGRLSFPVFFFLIGYSKKTSSDRWLYIYAFLILIVNLIINFPPFPLNILFTAIATRLLLNFIHRYKFLETKPYQAILLLSLWSVVSMLIFDYGTIAVLLACMGYLVRINKRDFSTKIFFIATLLMHFALQRLAFNLNIYESLFLFSLFSVEFFILYNFKLKTLVKNKFFANPITLIARNSLHIYALHFIAFEISDKILDPQEYMSFRWFLGF